MRNVRFIVSIDGGGIRGVLPLTVLDFLDKEIKRLGLGASINEKIDFFAGTSTGAIIAAALMLENDGDATYSPAHVLELYKGRGSQIFDPSREDEHHGPALKLVLDNNFGHLKLSDLTKRFAFVSYDETSKNPFTFHCRQDAFRDLPLSKVLYACSAVSDYFPPVSLLCYRLSDGINTAKNPAAIALRYARAYFPEDLIVMLSIGTGELPQEQFDAIEEDVLEVHDRLQLRAKRNHDFIYYRLQPSLVKGNHAMDDSSPENIENLIEDGKAYVEQNEELLKEIAKRFDI